MDKKVLLSTLWIFLVVNFIFCDVFTLMHSEDLKSLLSGNTWKWKNSKPLTK